ncbi:cleft lip and palate transmembrane protein 1 homolog [Portunus trituberculatus]|uniref:cleft lip and palate transmembrane protein 1 homolog n=1 Tax=Portunus trituberculatus TaxID=210409 RepID=UPI001E1CBC33|nr:cleft lip and palate transmembrane protein 1 homolog [Portunus trituberculatus]
MPQDNTESKGGGGDGGGDSGGGAEDSGNVGGEVAVVGAAAEGQVEGQQGQQQGQERQPTAGESFLAITKSLVIRAIIIYFITSFFRRPQQPTPAPGDAPLDMTGGGPAAVKIPATNLFTEGASLDLYVYKSESEMFGDFNDDSALVWKKENLVYGDWTGGPNGDGTFTHSMTFTASERLRNNGSVYIHVYFVRSGFSPDPAAGSGHHSRRHTLYASQRLNKYKRRRFRKTANLITGETSRSAEEILKAETLKEEILSHWHPNMTINLVHDFTQWTRGAVPPPLDEFVEFTASGDRYKPITFLNTYWNLVKDYQPINSTTTDLELSLTFQPLSLFKWQLYAAQAMKSRWPGTAILEGLGGEEDEEEQDTIKEAFLETSPYLLGLTILVSLLHSVFEFLAFKNDIQFWNNRDSLEGLSVRSVFFNVFQSVIVLLYVLDNETNFVIKVSCFVGLGIEVWKITKVTDVSLDREHRIFGLPRVRFTDKSTYVHSNTRQYDQLAFRYLSVCLFPLLGGYCVYSLVYNEHKGWYSFVLSMLYGFLLTFGFIMMTPQLFINYKLKSVAHLPWRMLTYKALNTFIDDIFAFVIKMPTMYRLGCLRDDVIFFIFLYQRYIYRVDPSRVNEFGFSQDMETKAKEKKLQVASQGAGPAAVGNGSAAAEEAEAEKSLEEKKKD